MKLTKNDLRMLSATERACAKFDGFAPYGAADWKAARRLEGFALVEWAGVGICDDCDSPKHRDEPAEVPLCRITTAGKEALLNAYETGGAR